MCGITGWLSSKKITTDEQARLDRMVATLEHRGPDGQGSSIVNHAALGHTRLAIIDPAEGAQPMYSLDGNASIVFNGEIYNFQDLRKDMISKGYQFRTHSDTEVILNLYLAEGINGFSRLRGMYAFVIWDKITRQAVLARDPLGIKPLFIETLNDGTLLFGSEAKAIIAYHKDRPRLDESSLHLLLNFRYLPGSRSMFRGITQLAPGTAMLWHIDGGTKTFSISLPEPDRLSVMDTLQDSIRVHFTSDVEVGAYLSGGMDSATIAAVGKEMSPMPLRTFTLDVGDDPAEAINAAKTAQVLGIENIQGRIDNGIEEKLLKLLWHLETPKINALQVSELAQVASQHVKVVLSGLGGDELFLGYNAHKIMYRYSQLSRFLPEALTSFIGQSGSRAITAISSSTWTEPERGMRMLAASGNWHKVYGLLRNLWDNPQMRAQIYGPRLLDIELPNAFDELGKLWPDNPDPVTAMAEYEWKNKMVNDLLWQEDRVSMATGLEVRVPFVDGILSQSVQALGRQNLMPRGQLKSYMRNMLRNILPEQILDRPKSGFQVSSPDFYQKHLATIAKSFLSEHEIRKYGLFNPAFVSHLTSRPINKHHRWHYFILYFMLLSHMWIKLFEEGTCTLQK